MGEHNMQSFEEHEFVRAIEQVDLKMVRIYAYYQILDCLFCFVYSMFLCDLITVCLDQVTHQKHVIRWLDILPFTLAFIDFIENFLLILVLIYYPYGPTPILLPLAASLSFFKRVAFFVIIPLSFLCVVIATISVIIRCFSHHKRNNQTKPKKKKLISN